MDEITRLQADVLKVLASPLRLEILHRLADGPLEVSRIAAAIGASQPNASQHLSVLRAAGLVDPEVIVACDVMRGVLQRRLARFAHLATTPAPHLIQLGRSL